MKLYHGSNVVVEKPHIIVANRALDFGSGFYATSDERQAIRWARLQTHRRRTGRPLVSVYEFDESAACKLATLRFDRPDRAWLQFVSLNRKNAYQGVRYDIVSGPVANDRTMAVIGDYMAGAIDVETALVLLKPQVLTDQYAFLTGDSLSSLRFLEVRCVD